MTSLAGPTRAWRRSQPPGQPVSCIRSLSKSPRLEAGGFFFLRRLRIPVACQSNWRSNRAILAARLGSFQAGVDAMSKHIARSFLHRSFQHLLGQRIAVVQAAQPGQGDALV